MLFLDESPGAVDFAVIYLSSFQLAPFNVISA